MMKKINTDTAKNRLTQLQPPTLDQDIDSVINATNELLYSCARDLQTADETQDPISGLNRWERIIESHKARDLWKAI